jgi:hypothetical protein
MLKKTSPFFHFLTVVPLFGACTVDRAVEMARSSGSTGAGGSGIEDAGADSTVCAYGQVICEGNVAKKCDGKGSFASIEPCGERECKDGQGCVTCVPNTGACDAQTKIATLCDSTGAVKTTFACDGPGMRCEPQGCRGPCSPGALGTTNTGCEFWPTASANGVWGAGATAHDAGADAGGSSGFHFGVLIGNPSTTDPATVGITDPATINNTGPVTKTVTLMPSEVQAVAIDDWVADLKGHDWQTPYQPSSPTQSIYARNGAYRIQSDRPIVAYQFNPIEGELPWSPNCPAVTMPSDAPQGCFSYSSDASLLLPTHALFASTYTITGYHAWHQDSYPPDAAGHLDMGDFITITATGTQPNAPTPVTVTLRPNETVLPWPSGPQFVSGQPFFMNPGDVVQFFTPGKAADQTLSGATITSGSRPIHVVSGVACASIPLDPAHCGHIEDSVIPEEALGKEYVVPVLRAPSTGAAADPPNVAHTIRVQAVSDGTAITFEPTMLSGVTLNSGEFVDIPNVTVDVRISSTVPFGVTQFVNGRWQSAPNGGPSQVTVVPSSQFQMSYAFAASPRYDENNVCIIAPTGASVSLDGQPVVASLFKAVGASGMSVVHVPLTGNDKVHVVSANNPIGIVVYGYTPYASYAYPGGLDLRHGPASP